MAFPLYEKAVLRAMTNEPSDARKVRGKALGYAVDKIILLGIAANVREREHHNGTMGCRGWAWGNVTNPCAKFIQDDSIGTYRTGYVFKCLLTQIDEPEFELVPDKIVGRRRDTDAARFGDTLKSCCDIDAVTKDVLTLDQDVSEVDPDPVEHTPVLWNTVVAFGHHRLHSYRAFDRIDHRGKLEQHAVSGGLDDPASMLRHQRIGDGAVFAEGAGGADLV